MVDGARRSVDVAVNTPMLPYALDGLGVALFEKFEFSGSSSDLDDAIRFARMALEACPQSDRKFRPAIMNNLAMKLKERARKTNDTNDIEEGIQLCKEALGISSDQGFRHALLISLSALLGLLYRRRQNIEDLEEAIQANREAVKLAKDGSEQKAIGHNNLGNRLENLYTRTGNPEQLNEAIQSSREALRCTSDEMFRASRLNNLAKRLIYRYERTMNLRDLNEAIGFSERAVAIELTRRNTDWPGFADRFALALHLRYKRTGEGDVETCIRILREAIDHETLDRGHPETRGLLNNLGSLYMTLYRDTGDVASLEASREAFQEAIAMGDDAGDADHPLQLERLSNLGAVHYELYYQTNPETTELLEEALRFVRRAVNGCKDDHPNKARFQTDQGMTCEDLGYCEEAYEAFTQSAGNLYALPSIRLQSARRALRIAAGKGERDKAISLAKNASKLLPLVCSRYLSLQDQEYTIKDVSGLAADSCSLLLMGGRPEEALQQLEFGRGLILGYLLDSKSDLSLMKEDPEARELVERYEQLRDDISKPVEPGQMSGARDQIINEIERCVDDIRKLPKYSSFLSEPVVEDILSAAEHGPVIIVNCTDFASHAIIIWQGKITSLLVDQLSMESAPEAVQERLKRYGRCTRGLLDRTIGRDTGIRRESEFLSWLWNSCVKTVLEELESLGFSLDGQQRVWWIGTGIASSFPFHAAGLHASRPSECTLAQVNSSYVPTIKTLLFSRSQSAKETHLEGGDRVLFVGMPTTPGDSRLLPGVLKEEGVVRKACSEKYPFEARMHPTADQVVEGIAESKVLHLACHGWSDPKNPSESHLLLQKQDETGAIVDKLTVARLSNVRETDNAFLVFLSACSTAEVKVASKLADEALHLASIFQISGFPHAIGSLWSASDPICVQVADEFYRSLFGAEHGGLSDDGVAKALHSAIQKVRFRSRDPEVWAPFVHFGA